MDVIDNWNINVIPTCVMSTSTTSNHVTVTTVTLRLRLLVMNRHANHVNVVMESTS